MYDDEYDDDFEDSLGKSGKKPNKQPTKNYNSKPSLNASAKQGTTVALNKTPAPVSTKVDLNKSGVRDSQGPKTSRPQASVNPVNNNFSSKSPNPPSSKVGGLSSKPQLGGAKKNETAGGVIKPVGGVVQPRNVNGSLEKTPGLKKGGVGVSSTPNMSTLNRPKPLRAEIQTRVDSPSAVTSRNIATTLNTSVKRSVVPHKFVPIDNAEKLIQETSQKINEFVRKTNDIVDTDIDNAYDHYSKENKYLQKSLRKLHEAINDIFNKHDPLTQPTKIYPQTDKPIEKPGSAQLKSRTEEVKNAQKGLANIMSEYEKVKSRVDNVKSPSYITELHDQLDQLNTKIKSLEKGNRQLNIEQKKRELDMEKMLSQGAPQALFEIKELQAKVTNMKDALRKEKHEQDRLADLVYQIDQQDIVLKEREQKLLQIVKQNGISLESTELDKNSEENEKKQNQKHKYEEHLHIADRATKAMKKKLKLQSKANQTKIQDLLQRKQQLMSSLEEKQISVKEKNIEINDLMNRNSKKIPAVGKQDSDSNFKYDDLRQPTPTLDDDKKDKVNDLNYDAVQKAIEEMNEKETQAAQIIQKHIRMKNDKQELDELKKAKGMAVKPINEMEVQKKAKQRAAQGNKDVKKPDDAPAPAPAPAQVKSPVKAPVKAPVQPPAPHVTKKQTLAKRQSDYSEEGFEQYDDKNKKSAPPQKQPTKKSLDLPPNSDPIMQQVLPVIDKIFTQFDVDKSGYLSRSEAEVQIADEMKRKGKPMEAKAVDEQFKMMDLDSDGYISREECTYVFYQMFKGLQESMNKAGKALDGDAGVNQSQESKPANKPAFATKPNMFAKKKTNAPTEEFKDQNLVGSNLNTSQEQPIGKQSTIRQSQDFNNVRQSNEQTFGKQATQKEQPSTIGTVGGYEPTVKKQPTLGQNQNEGGYDPTAASGARPSRAQAMKQQEKNYDPFKNYDNYNAAQQEKKPF